MRAVLRRCAKQGAGDGASAQVALLPGPAREGEPWSQRLLLNRNSADRELTQGVGDTLQIHHDQHCEAAPGLPPRWTEAEPVIGKQTQARNILKRQKTRANNNLKHMHQKLAEGCTGEARGHARELS